MKKFLTSRIFAFILGAIIFGGIGAVSAYTLLAANISYTPSDNTWKKGDGENITNVQDALDELYTETNKDILTKLNLSNRKFTTLYDYGIGQSRTVNFDLEKGSYLIFSSEALTLFSNSTPSETTNNTSFPKATTSNGTCTEYSGRWVRSNGKEQINGSNLVSLSRQKIFQCTLSTSGTITVTTSADASKSHMYNSNLISMALKLD